MHFRSITVSLLAAVLALGLLSTALAQGGGTQTSASAGQRLDVMRSQLEALRRSLGSAIAGIPEKPATDKKAANPDDPRVRLQGLDKEVSSILSEVNDIHSKLDRSEKYDATRLDSLESSVKEIQARVQTALTETAGARTGNSAVASGSASHSRKKKGRLFGLLGGGGGNSKYDEILGGPAPGRDRVLFEEAAKEVRKGSHETGRLLFTTIITTYPDSPFLPLAKLAIADSFYLEGGTSSLIQAAASYQDWLTFFPTDPLAPAAMLKVAEAEMRQMGLSDRDVTHARRAEQRLKALLQQYPQTKLRPIVEDRLYEVQENLGMHNLQIGSFYWDRYIHNPAQGGLKGAQNRLRENAEKYPCFSYGDKNLFILASTYQLEEEPDEAAKYYQQLIRNYPDSEYTDKAKEQLNIIGAPVPEPGPQSNCPKRERPSFMGNLMQQVAGRADVTVGKDGILISRDSKEGDDLIDEALKNNGQLRSDVMPLTPRSKPRQVTPANEEQTAPDKKKIGVTIQSTPNGPVPNRINPSAPAKPPPPPGKP